VYTLPNKPAGIVQLFTESIDLSDALFDLLA